MNRIDLEGRRAVITGGARGIGLATAERMLESGASVVLWDVDGAAIEAALASLAEKGLTGREHGDGEHGGSEHGERASGTVVELTDEASVDAAAKEALAAGAIDILVNNAGITGGNGKTWELEPSIWRKTLEVNLVGPYLTARALVPSMIAAGYGRIVNVASIAGKEGNPNASHYSASKAGLIGLTKSLGKELAGAGVLVNCITPAAARTAIFDQMSQEHIDYMLSKIPLARFVEPAEVAAMIVWLASEDCSFSTGAAFDISGGRAVY
ncbi:SDR family NAD(P)-dependent oxidoreductase [Aurantimonas sp. 22II-16-19i]|uniref:SDR family NAD(P)-dependent oxidoreductase n=1 Tax=Aurantimonas sp. 22II-16-19i TaxID=1317114 RepID=UPI0009F7FDED|nr:SDR family NAD(P)-dependent oxidoreductase [Aurantimonas sp. 22II-16-19i]ORE92071.1 short-chain dehydrogenase/reductase [Aurantimonas sp. 22II-16-19i]